MNEGKDIQDSGWSSDGACSRDRDPEEKTGSRDEAEVLSGWRE